jgi:hypothetical protein
MSEVMAPQPTTSCAIASSLASCRGALFSAASELIGLMNEMADERRVNPTDVLTSKLVHKDLGEDMLAPEEIRPFFTDGGGRETTRPAPRSAMA